MPAQVRNVTANRQTQPTDVSFIGESNGSISRINTSKNIEGLASSAQEYFSQVANNYDSLTKGTKDGILAFVENSQGTSWLPFTLGGTYYPSGLYVWDEPTQTWASSRTKIAEGIDAASGTSSSGSISYNDLTDLPTIPTQITDAEITALGYVKTDNDTQLTDFDITALGYIKTDTNTQLSDSDITNLGYIKTFTDTNTQLSDSDITALGYVKTTGTQISLFQVQDDGVTGQTVTNGYLNVQGLWNTPSITNSDFSFDASLGHLTTNVAGIIEIDTQMLAYSVLNNRVQLMVQIQKNGATLTIDSNYATRNVTQRTGSASIHGFKDSCSIGDIYKIRVKKVGQEVSLGTVGAAKGCYFSAKIYK
tara:strand:- start:159 stop:1250 length:1092 start_codon:yes stop_codon:yes gene_type:complete